MDNRPIGVFDSGLGGLTVLRQAIKVLDKEKFIYVADTKRMPYGNKTRDEIIEYSFQISEFLKNKDVKALLIACNTVSSMAYENIRDNFDIPIIMSVLNEGVDMTLKEGGDLNITFIGTKGTVESNVFEDKIYKNDPDRKIRSIPCLEFAEIVERGKIHTGETELLVEKYLKDQREYTDILVYGCTHYPLLGGKIRNVLGDKIYIDPSIGMAKRLKDLLEEYGLETSEDNFSIDFYVSEGVESFKNKAELILDMPISKVNLVDLDK